MTENRIDLRYQKVTDLKAYADNPRDNNAKAVAAVAESIKEFGFRSPILVDENNEIIAGHTRLLASKKLGLLEVPTIVVTDLNEEQITAYRIADNKTNELSQWDDSKLRAELDKIQEIPMDKFGVTLMKELEQMETERKERYNRKIDIPQYQIKGTKPEMFELVDKMKHNQLMNEIEDYDITDEEKAFLRLSSARHLAFNYSNVAEYYAHATADMQRAMESHALVIIDFDDAIKNGYVKLTNSIQELIGEEREK